MMKTRTTAIMLLVISISTACTENNPEPGSEASMADVLFSCGEPSTRSDISSLAVFAFTEDGNLANSAVSTGTSIKMKVPKKTLSCYAVVNSHASLDDVLTESRLLSKVSFLKDNSLEDFEMAGSVCTDIKGNDNVSITVDRFAALLQLEKVTLRWKEQYKYPGITITRIFAENVVPRCLYSFESANVPSDIWFNRMKWESNLNGLLGSQENLAVENGSTVNCDKSLCVYPNPVKSDAQGITPYSERYTRLVVEVLCSDTVWYYPVSIPEIKPNTCYIIKNLIITGPGSDNSDKEVSRSSISIELQISSWGNNYSFEESM